MLLRTNLCIIKHGKFQNSDAESEKVTGKMFEDGVYVSHFSDDEDKEGTPKSVVIIKNGKIQIFVNPATPDDTANFLTSLAKAFTEAVTEDEKDFAVARLGKYWESNGYSPNPSDFFELDSDDARRSVALSRNWTSKQHDATEQASPQEWRGTGDYFPHLEVLETVNVNEYRVLAWGKGQYTDKVKVISAKSLDEAIAYIRKYDSDYFDEVTLYGEEGG